MRGKTIVWDLYPTESSHCIHRLRAYCVISALSDTLLAFCTSSAELYEARYGSIASKRRKFADGLVEKLAERFPFATIP